MSSSPPSILVIRHGALGDIVLSTGPFAAIRAHHPEARIVALTTPPFHDLLAAMPWFDEVWTDTRPKWWQVRAWWNLRRRLREGKFARVYDLQTSSRSSGYFTWIFGRGVEWSGIAAGACFRHDTPERTRSHTVERQKAQLALASIGEVPPPSLDFLKADLSKFKLPARYALIVPGGSAHRPEKRWPAERYAEAVAWLMGVGVTPLLIGTKAEADELKLIARACKGARNLCGKTNFAELASLARGAVVALGNDTGPLHLIAVAGAPVVALFSDASDPALCAPRGASVTVLRESALADLLTEPVLDALREKLAANG